ncbi:MAG: phosphoribosyl-ATP diphosphatase [Alphaproteobacteria bacterium]|nr:phosphoribosyl-ATP diphosphatase [Alphaproteobacteria bacterium]
MATEKVLAELFAVIEARRGAPADESYTSALFAKGLLKITQKLGEEAVETVIAGVRRDTAEIASESADLLYHLLVLWAEAGVAPEDVWRNLEARRAKSGLAEKAERKERSQNSLS